MYRAHRLPITFYQRDTIQVARDLLGTCLVHLSRDIERVGKIVEVEAYLGPQDLAAHSSKGLTKRTRVLFGPPGHAYVYLVYGLHWCMNVVTGEPGQGSAVLLRAIEPICNIEGGTRGPGLLCRAMEIDGHLNGCSLAGDDFYIAAPAGETRQEIVERPRVGVDYAGTWAQLLLRFYLKGNPFISRP